MKKILSLCAALIMSIGIFATPPRIPDSSVKIQKIFQHDFPEVSQFKIYEQGFAICEYNKLKVALALSCPAPEIIISHETAPLFKKWICES